MGLLVGTVIIVGALTFFPALSLGPIVEHYLMHSGKLFLACWRFGDKRMPTLTDPQAQSSPQIPPDDPTSLLPKKLVRARPLFDPEIVRRAVRGVLRQAEPGHVAEEPGDVCRRGGRRDHHGVPDPRSHSPGRRASDFQFQISLWLWFTVLFANFAEAMAEARGKAQADALRKTKTDVARQSA